MQSHACPNPQQNFAADVRILLSIWARVFKCSALFSRVRWALAFQPRRFALRSRASRCNLEFSLCTLAISQSRARSFSGNRDGPSRPSYICDPTRHQNGPYVLYVMLLSLLLKSMVSACIFIFVYLSICVYGQIHPRERFGLSIFWVLFVIRFRFSYTIELIQRKCIRVNLSNISYFP